MRFALCLLLAPLLILPAPAAAQSGPQREELQWSWAVDPALIVLTGAGWIGTEMAKDSLAPQACRWCEANSLDASVTGALGWGSRKTASVVSDSVTYGVMPVLTLAGGIIAGAADGRIGETPVNALLIVEAVTVSSMINQVFKFSFGRERPFVAELPAEEKSELEKAEDNNLSFYSGHTNLAFALAVSAGTVAHLRGYKAEPYIWGIGLPLATFVAYSRIAAKKHYLSDVVIGSLTGAAAGFLVPFLHRKTSPLTASGASLSIAPAVNGLSIGGTF